MIDKKIIVKFYQSQSGREPVREWLKSLETEERKVIGVDIKKEEYGYPLGMPTCRPMGDGLLEVRTNLPQGKIARVLFCVRDSRMILLHGFIKKTQKTAKQELDIAKKRKQNLETL
jgi:phage-related protein